MRHAVSIDVEDYRQLLSMRFRGEPGPVAGGFERDMETVLSILDSTATSATFFVTGTVAGGRPGLLRRWADLGHEIASHGYAHAPIWTTTPEALKEELRSSKGAIEDAIGMPVKGYRAPVFSVRWDTLWALNVIRDCGFTYDSSIVPVRTRRYGIAGFDPEPARYVLPSGGDIVEIPLTTARAWGMRVPVAGGGYFRLFSRRRICSAVASCDARGVPFVMYCHPYEFRPERLSFLDLARSWRGRLAAGMIAVRTNIGRRKIPGLVRRILSEFRFSTLGRLAERVRSDGRTKVLGAARQGVR